MPTFGAVKEEEKSLPVEWSEEENEEKNKGVSQAQRIIQYRKQKERKAYKYGAKWMRPLTEAESAKLLVLLASNGYAVSVREDKLGIVISVIGKEQGDYK